jgi:hypothetical protein
MDIAYKYESLKKCYKSLIENYNIIEDKESSRARFIKRQIEVCSDHIKDIERSIARMHRPVRIYNPD